MNQRLGRARQPTRGRARRWSVRRGWASSRARRILGAAGCGRAGPDRLVDRDCPSLIVTVRSCAAHTPTPVRSCSRSSRPPKHSRARASPAQAGRSAPASAGVWTPRARCCGRYAKRCTGRAWPGIAAARRGRYGSQSERGGEKDLDCEVVTVLVCGWTTSAAAGRHQSHDRAPERDQ
jgi:hypothetical protein